MIDDPIELVLARSSLGGHAWCFTCHHPDLVHRDGVTGCTECECPELRRMTPEDWLAWRYPDFLSHPPDRLNL